MTTNSSSAVMSTDASNRFAHQLPAMHLVRSYWLVRFAARATFVVLFLALFAMIFVPWQQSSRGYGRVVAYDPQEREQKVTATAKGIIVRIREGLREGSYVEQGDLVMVLEPLARDAQKQIETQIDELKTKAKAAEAKIKFRAAGDRTAKVSRRSHHEFGE